MLGATRQRRQGASIRRVPLPLLTSDTSTDLSRAASFIGASVARRLGVAIPPAPSRRAVRLVLVAGNRRCDHGLERAS